MKKVLIFCMVLIFSSSLFGTEGLLRITANMSDVDIYIGGKQVAMLGDDTTDLKLETGKYTITLIKPIDKEHEYKAVKKVFVGDAITRVKFELKTALTKEGEAKQAKEDEDFISKDGIVYDKRLNLTWQDDYEAQSVKKKWKEAKKYCANLNLAGFSDWRLPSIEELLSITDVSRYKPAIRKAFKNMKGKYYWSSTSSASNSSSAWRVYFEYGDNNENSKSFSQFVRCVR